MTPIRVLIVDDERANLETFRRVFRKSYDVSIAESGLEALALLEHTTFDVIVSDYGMPVMNGAEFLRRAAPIQPHAIILVVTGYGDLPEVVAMKTSGLAYAVIAKPWRRELLVQTIDQAVEDMKGGASGRR